MKNLFFLFLFILPTFSAAQSNEILARSEFMIAEEAYGTADYDKTIKHLNQAIEYLGTSNPKIQALIVKSHYANGQFEEAKQAMETYFELADESDGDFMEMVRLIGIINEAAEEVEGEEQAWADTEDLNTIEAYQSFLNVYPNGEHHEEAKQKAIDLSWKQVLQSMDRKDFDEFVHNFPDYSSLLFLEMEMIPGGTFEMGNGSAWQKPIHTTELDSFYLGTYEVTYQQYETFLANINDPNRRPEWAKPGNIFNVETGEVKDHYQGSHLYAPNNPIVAIYWIDAIYFCNFLSHAHGFQEVYTIEGEDVTANWEANGYRLPTEAEWEYAAGGGVENRTTFPGTNERSELSIYGNHYKGTSSEDKITQPVGSYLPNSLGLYDMLANAHEWCWDFFDPDYYKNFENVVAINPRGPLKDIGKGHSFKGIGHHPKIFTRLFVYPKKHHTSPDLGFRIARSVRP